MTQVPVLGAAAALTNAAHLLLPPQVTIFQISLFSVESNERLRTRSKVVVCIERLFSDFQLRGGVAVAPAATVTIESKPQLYRREEEKIDKEKELKTFVRLHFINMPISFSFFQALPADVELNELKKAKERNLKVSLTILIQ